MKKVFTGTIVFIILTIFVAVLQSSCSKTNAQNTNSTTQLGKIVYSKYTGAEFQIWIANYDGTNATQIPISLPTNVFLNFGSPTSSLSVSPDGQKIFFTCYNSGSNEIYSCSISGGNATLTIPNASGTNEVGFVHAF